jgi:hypothetical protein
MVSSNDVMPLFLQAIMTRRLVTEQTARKLWEKCIEAVNGERYYWPCRKNRAQRGFVYV